jgi:putative polyhydroxyalkanoate system protein
MSDVKVHQAHNHGLPRARVLAKQWVDNGARKMGLECKYEEGADQDVITFERMGVTGAMTVTATSFDMEVKLGMMMKAFKPMIEAEISKNLGRIAGKTTGTA